MTSEEIFQMYDHVLYVAFKWSITIPATLLGNAADLLTLGLSKQAIDVSPLMSQFPFFREVTRTKEKLEENTHFFNKGFGGVCRAVASIVGELPFSAASVALAAVLTILHVVIANTIGIPLLALGEFVMNNMCGCNP